MKRISLLFICALLAINANAQNKWDKDTDVIIDIDGIKFWESLTRKEFERHFGHALSDRYIEEDMGNYYLLEYEGVKIYLDEDGRMSGFEVDSSKYPIMTLYGLGEGIRVGDTWEKFLSMGYPIYSIKEVGKRTNDVRRYDVALWHKNIVADRFTIFTVENGVITNILSDVIAW